MRLLPRKSMTAEGQSAALLAGMRRAKGEYILTLDADLQNDPGDFPKILALLKEYDCVCGYRAQRQDAWLRSFISRVANRVLRWMVGNPIRDAGCGTKGFRLLHAVRQRRFGGFMARDFENRGRLVRFHGGSFLLAFLGVVLVALACFSKVAQRARRGPPVLFSRPVGALGLPRRAKS